MFVLQLEPMDAKTFFLVNLEGDILFLSYEYLSSSNLWYLSNLLQHDVNKLGNSFPMQAENASDQMDWVEKITGVIASLLSFQSPDRVKSKRTHSFDIPFHLYFCHL